MGFIREKINHLLLWAGSPILYKLVSINPKYAYLRVTENCNSKCKTCFAWKNKSINELTTEELVDTLEQLKDIGVKIVWLSGGEPLLRNDIGYIVKKCELLGFKVFVQTNGLLLEDRASELIESGVTHVDVSIDGVGETDDWIRGVPHSFEKAVRGIEKINEIKKKKNLELPGVTVFTTLLKQNFGEIPLLIELCKDLGVFWDFSLPDDNIDFFKDVDLSEFRITDEKQIDLVISYLKKICYESPRVISPSHNDLSLEYARKYLKGNAVRLPCFLGFSHICVGSHGEVYSGCLAQQPVGNIRESDLRQILQSRRYREYVKKMCMKQCKGCTFFFTTNLYTKHLLSYLIKSKTSLHIFRG